MKPYNTWEELVEAEANGWCVVVMMKQTARKSGRVRNYTRVIGPFTTQKEAKKIAARVRAGWKKSSTRGEIEPGVELLGVGVEPAWKEWS